MVSVETVNDVLKTLLAAEEGEPKSSVRRAQRVNYSGDVLVTFAESSGQGTLVTLHDISSRGMSFPWPRAIAIGASFTARIQRPDSTAVRIGCQVVHCRAREHGQFNIGAEFRQILDRGPINSAA